MTTAVKQSQHFLKINVMELLNRKGYSTATRPKQLILGSLFLEEFSITKPSESQMIVEKKRVQILKIIKSIS